MPRAATVIKFTSFDGETVVDFSGCRGYPIDANQFLDDEVRESMVKGADGTPHFQAVAMGANHHRGNQYGVTMENVEAAKVLALITLNKAMKALGSYMLVSLTDAMINLVNVPSKADPEAEFWITQGRESEGMVQDVTVRLVALI